MKTVFSWILIEREGQVNRGMGQAAGGAMRSIGELQEREKSAGDSPNTNRAVPRRARKHASIRREGHRKEPSARFGESSQRTAVAAVPHAKRIIHGARRQQGSIRGKGHTLNRRVVTGEQGDLAARVNIPQTYAAIVGAGGQAGGPRGAGGRPKRADVGGFEIARGEGARVPHLRRAVIHGDRDKRVPLAA